MAGDKRDDRTERANGRSLSLDERANEILNTLQAPLDARRVRLHPLHTRIYICVRV